MEVTIIAKVPGSKSRYWDGQKVVTLRGAVVFRRRAGRYVMPFDGGATPVSAAYVRQVCESASNWDELRPYLEGAQ